MNWNELISPLVLKSVLGWKVDGVQLLEETMKMEADTLDVVVTSLKDVPNDMRRALKIQFKEFIHTIEDHMFEASSLFGPSAKVVDLRAYWSPKRKAC